VTGEVRLRPIEPDDRSWLTAFFTDRWGAPVVAGGGRLHQLDRLAGLVAERSGAVAGVVTWVMSGDECEIVSIDAVQEGRGVGTALLEAACATAATAGCTRVHLITTNDNVRALAFYQRRGFVLAELRPGAVDEARRLKPGIPAVAENGIPIRDELVLERPLS
jgi:ribosomal protein S18 acetylase RimI-like enzyme